MATVTENAIGSGDRQFPHRRTSFSQPPTQSPPSDDGKSNFRSDVRKLIDLLSKLNPSTKEFVPSSKIAAPAAKITPRQKPNGALSADAPVFVAAGGGGVEFVNNKDAGNDGPGNNHCRGGILTTNGGDG